MYKSLLPAVTCYCLRNVYLKLTLKHTCVCEIQKGAFFMMGNMKARVSGELCVSTK